MDSHIKYLKYKMTKTELHERAKKIKLLLTDCDGVLTDNGVYYGEAGEVLKRFSIRDGMGVERLRNGLVTTGIITGENSPSLVKRAEKLLITELHLGIKNKRVVLDEILAKYKYTYDQIAYIGDDLNDFEILRLVGLSACPADAVDQVQKLVHYHCKTPGGYGCFREFAEMILLAQLK
jgi:3-deoxy-D-manno-octulosonate 8-phosphate phosphatase (KDO 8-P phosphatase)